MNTKSERLISLDVFRGLTIAGMVLVNNPGTRDFVYPALDHASWHGVTPTDLIFPFFLFIVGIAITLSLDKRLKKGDDKKVLITHVIQRGITIFLLGEFMSGFPFFNANSMVAHGDSYWFIGLLLLFSFIYNLCIIISIYKMFPYVENLFLRKEKRDPSIVKKLLFTLSLLIILIILFPYIFPDNRLSSIRIPGVLQRIAVVYSISSIIFIFTDVKKIIFWIIGLLVFYMIFMLFYPVPGFGAGQLSKEGNFAAYFDNMVLNGHMWVGSKTWDPEGIFSTLPAIATAMFGILTGGLLKSEKSIHEKINLIFVYGCLLSVLGIIMDMWIPINKSLWTASYSLYCAGIALFFLGISIYLVDVKKYDRLFRPCIIYGMNAITVFFLSGMMARVMFIYKLDYHGTTVNIQTYLYLTFFAPLFGNLNGSLAYALTYVMFWLLMMWILYKKKIFIKV